MQVNNRKVYNCIGMTSDYTKIGQVNINLLDYIDEILDDFDKAGPRDGSTK